MALRGRAISSADVAPETPVLPAVVHQRVARNPALIFAAILAFVFALHIPLLRLPYFWDEAGYYVPTARDLLTSGSVIPYSTPSNAHPPLVMAYLALWWRIAGYAPLVTRTAMLVAAAFALTGFFRLAQRVTNTHVSWAATLCVAIYPVFFTQNSLAHVDLAAAGLTFFGLRAYIENKRLTAACWFSMAVLAKETAVIAPIALLCWEAMCLILAARLNSGFNCSFPRLSWKSALLAVPVLVLSCWYAYHYEKTGFVFGNHEFFRYNVEATLHPLRIALALLMRLWQLFGYLGLYLLTAAGLLALLLPPLSDGGGERSRIALTIQFALIAVILAYTVGLSVIGGAVLARYMLPVVPLVILMMISTLWRRVRLWREVVAIVAGGFLVALLANPPYGFSLEDNLAYRDYIRLHQAGENYLTARYPMARVLTAWPASDELTRPYLGYVTRPMQIVRIENFTLDEVISAAEARSSFDVALVFSTTYVPPHPFFEGWLRWQEWKTRFFGYHRDLPPAAVAEIIGGRVVFVEHRAAQWIAIIEIERAVNAKLDVDSGPQHNTNRATAMSRE